jgi:hypothetical protein
MLSEYVGIGKTKLSYKDMIMAYSYKNKTYFSEPDIMSNNNICFLGILDTTPVNGQNIRFYDNDEQAFGDGIQYLRDYYLSNTNTYGLPFGTKKKQVEYGSV